MDKSILGIVAIIIGLIGYVPYFRDIFRRSTKPHAFTWFVWASLTTIAFFGQLSDGAGAGAWVTGFTAFISIIIFFFALFWGEKNITHSDWWSLIGAVCALGLWGITHNPLYAIILITIIDALGFYPTFRKSYNKPYQETLSTYTLSSIKFVVALIALESYTVTTWLYPFSLVIMNAAFVAMLYVRRKRIYKDNITMNMEKNADGKEKRPQVGLGILIQNDKKEVLLGRRKGSHGAGEWAFPGGHLEFGETIFETARREIAEETGLTAGNMELISVSDEMRYITSDGKHYLNLGIRAECDGEPKVLELHKCEEWEWFSLDNLPENIYEGTGLIIKALTSGTVYEEGRQAV